MSEQPENTTADDTVDAAAGTPEAKVRGERKTREGLVVSDKMNKTIAVEIERLVKHPRYGKYIRRSTKLHAHDADNSCNEGDTVRVAECAPMSKTKNWRVVEILARAAD